MILLILKNRCSYTEMKIWKFNNKQDLKYYHKNQKIF